METLCSNSALQANAKFVNLKTWHVASLRSKQQRTTFYVTFFQGSPRDNAEMATFHKSPQAPLNESELEELQALLDAVPPPLEPLDVSMLDGFLCGLLVQPVRVPASRWLPHITDADGRALPGRFDATRLHELALRRHAELNDAISRRQWFDPWVFELEGEDDEPSEVDAVYPWVAGFATAMELFPELMQRDAQSLTEPLALLYRHLSPDDLEDADELLEEIETLEPPEDLSEAVEGLVRATLLLADVGRPQPASNAAPKPKRPAPRRR